MKATLATLLVMMSLLAGVAGQASAATSANTRGHSVTSNVAAGEYDFPSFGSERWWESQEDRG